MPVALWLMNLYIVIGFFTPLGFFTKLRDPHLCWEVLLVQQNNSKRGSCGNVILVMESRRFEFLVEWDVIRFFFRTCHFSPLELSLWSNSKLQHYNLRTVRCLHISSICSFFKVDATVQLFLNFELFKHSIETFAYFVFVYWLWPLVSNRNLTVLGSEGNQKSTFPQHATTRSISFCPWPKDPQCRHGSVTW